MPPVKRSLSSGGSLAPGTAKVISKTEVAINLKGVEPGRRRRRVRIPEGEYHAKLVKAEVAKASTGNQMINWVFNLIDAEELNGTPFWYHTVLAESSMWNCRKVMEALGVKIPDSMMKIDLKKLAGRTCGLEIVDGEYEGTIRSEVADVFPESEFSKTEDEEEEDEGDEDSDEEESEESEEEEEESEDEEVEEEEDEEEIDLDSLDLDGLKRVAKQYGVSMKPPQGRDRISAKLLKQRILEKIESESEDEEDEEVDLDEVEL
jgi:hypothetical protein